MPALHTTPTLPLSNQLFWLAIDTVAAYYGTKMARTCTSSAARLLWLLLALGATLLMVNHVLYLLTGWSLVG